MNTNGELNELIEDSINKLKRMNKEVVAESKDINIKKINLLKEITDNKREVANVIFSKTTSFKELHEASLIYFPNNNVLFEMQENKKLLEDLEKKALNAKLILNDYEEKDIPFIKKTLIVSKEKENEINEKLNVFTYKCANNLNRIFNEMKITEKELTKKYGFFNTFNLRNKRLSKLINEVKNELDIDQDKIKENFEIYTNLKKEALPFSEQTRELLVENTEKKRIGLVTDFNDITRDIENITIKISQKYIQNEFNNIVVTDMSEEDFNILANTLNKSSIINSNLKNKAKMNILDSISETISKDQKNINKFLSSLENTVNGYKYKKAMRNYSVKRKSLKNSAQTSYNLIKESMNKLNLGHNVKMDWINNGVVKLMDLDIDLNKKKEDDDFELTTVFIATFLISSLAEDENALGASLLFSNNFAVDVNLDNISLPSNIKLDGLDLGNMDMGNLDVGNIAVDIPVESVSFSDCGGGNFD
jgi:hypothetical protein